MLVHQHTCLLPRLSVPGPMTLRISHCPASSTLHLSSESEEAVLLTSDRLTATQPLMII